MKKLILAAAAFAAITTGANALNAQGGWLNGEDEFGRRDRLFSEVATCKGGHPRMEAIRDVIGDELDGLTYPQEVVSIQWRRGLLTYIDTRIGNCPATTHGLVEFIKERNYTETVLEHDDFIYTVAEWYHETVADTLSIHEIIEARIRIGG